MQGEFGFHGGGQLGYMGADNTQEDTKGLTNEILKNIDPEELYNPSKPNDFEQLINEVKKQRRNAEIKKKKELELQILEKEREAAAPNIDLSMTGEDVYQMRVRRSTAVRKESPKSRTRKLMEGLGWKGGALGKSEQGELAPLLAEQRAGASNIIRQGEVKDIGQRKAEGEVVLMLSGMVAPDEIDNELEDEVCTEVQKYALVNKCTIHVIKNEKLGNKLPLEHRVRIFLHLGGEESFNRACSSLNNRYFGGRMVSASRFEEQRFNHKLLDPSEAEVNQMLKCLEAVAESK